MKYINVSVFVICLILTAITCRVYFQSGVPYSHDGENHLARFANYRAAIREGQIPPRFAPYLENGYGYPVFNYNYPLANILSVPLSLVGMSYETVFKILVLSFLSLGAFSTWTWLDRFTNNSYSKSISVLMWLSAPFLVSTFLFRGSIGELIVYGLLPLLFLSIHETIDRKTNWWHFAAWIAFFLAHNVSVLWITPILILYFIAFWKNRQFSKDIAIRFLYLFFIAIGATLWFWLPAILELPAIVLSGAENAQAFAAHFPTFHQLLSSPITFGYSFAGSVDSLSFALGSIVWVTFLLFPIWFITLGNKTLPAHKKYLTILFWISISLCIVLQLKFSAFIWYAIPVARFVQFPWRIGLIIPLLSTPLLAAQLSESSTLLRRIVFVGAVVYWLVITGIKPLEILHKTDVEYDSFVLNTTTQNENRSRNFSYKDIGHNPRQPFIVYGKGNISNIVWGGSTRSYDIVIFEPSIIIEPTMRFPGWETELNSTVIEYTDSIDIGGRLAYQVEPGTYHVTSRFTQRTPARRIGNAVSLFILVWLCISVLYKTKQRLT